MAPAFTNPAIRELTDVFYDTAYTVRSLLLIVGTSLILFSALI